MSDLYCLRCGAPLRDVFLEGRERAVCPACGWVYYPQLKVSAGALIEEDGRLLLVQRANEPWAGCWYMPAGFVEADEHPARAAEREASEETGLRVQAGELVNVYFYADDPRGSGVVILYRARTIGGQIRTNAEALSVQFFTPAEVMQLPLAGASADRAVHEWLSRQ